MQKSLWEQPRIEVTLFIKSNINIAMIMFVAKLFRIKHLIVNPEYLVAQFKNFAEHMYYVCMFYNTLGNLPS
jgi:hypothetical protein